MILGIVLIFIILFAFFGSILGLADPKPITSRTLVSTVERIETSEELTERLRREEAQQKRAEAASWEREFQEKLNEAFMPPVPKDYLEVPLNKNTTLHDEPSKWSPRQDVPKGTLIEIGGFVRGDEVQGNPIWYFDKKSERFFSSSDVDTHPRNLPQFRNEPRDTHTMSNMTGTIVRTVIESPTILSPMTKNPMHLTNPTTKD